MQQEGGGGMGLLWYEWENASIVSYFPLDDVDSYDYPSTLLIERTRPTSTCQNNREVLSGSVLFVFRNTHLRICTVHSYP